MSDIANVGRVLRTLRQTQNLSQIEVACKADMNLSYYSRIERGRGNPTLLKLFVILSALNISFEDFCYIISQEKFYYKPRFARGPQNED